MVAAAAQLDLVLELGMAKTLATDSVLHRVDDHGLLLALVALVAATGDARLLGGDALDADDAARKAAGELFGVLAEDGPGDGDGGQEPVRRRGDGGELGVVGADALVHVHLQVDDLARAELGDEDVGVHGPDHILRALEDVDLAARGDELDVAGVDVGVVVELGGVALARGGGRVAGTLDLQAQLDGVVVVDRARGAVLVLAAPAQEVADARLAAREGDQAEAVGEDLILDHGGVVVDVDGLDGEGGDLGDEDAAEGVGDGGVDANEGKGRLGGGQVVELDAEVVLEGFE